MHYYVIYVDDPQFEGPSEGNYSGSEKAKTLPEALGKALGYLDRYKGKNAKVEIVQLDHELPEGLI